MTARAGLRTGAIMLLLALLPAAVQADWRNTRWDMSVEQVAALFDGAQPITRLIPALGEPDVTAGLYASPADGQRATFYFRAGRLVRVDVEYAQARQCPDALEQLRRQYGPPLAVERTYDVLSVFTWFRGRDEIVLRWVDSGKGEGFCTSVQKKAFG
jgi:hypothetical protein